MTILLTMLVVAVVIIWLICQIALPDGLEIIGTIAIILIVVTVLNLWPLL